MSSHQKPSSRSVSAAKNQYKNDANVAIRCELVLGLIIILIIKAKVLLKACWEQEECSYWRTLEDTTRPSGGTPGS